MIIQTIEDRDTWSDFVTKNTTDTFLQSWEWGDFNTALGNTVWRIGVYEKKALIAVSLVIKIPALRGMFLFVPHGPVLKSNIKNKTLDVIKAIKEYLVALSKEGRCGFIRIAPVLKKSKENIKLFKNMGFTKAPMHVHSERCWVLDLQEPEDVLLANMRKTTRYLIRKSKQYDIKIEKSISQNDLNRFLAVYNQTQRRQHFVPFSENYLKKELSVFSKGNCASLYFATAKDGSESGALIITSGKSGFYHHGATVLKDPKTPLSYALQWGIIKDLKKEGFSHYNFWGIAPEDKPKHPWQGLSLFKKGFGGVALDFVPTQDYVVSPFYAVTWVVETGRRIKRGY